TPDTHHLISERELNRMKPDAILINTSRGPVLDEKALVTALREGNIRGAGLDVFENEPLIEAGLLEMDQVVVAPHIGSATVATRTKMAMIAIDNLMAVINGDHAPNLVNAEVYRPVR